MEPQGGAAEPGLIRRLLQEAPQFSFFQVVQLLEKARPGAAKVGREGPAPREAIRFHPTLSLGFPDADVAAVALEEGPDGAPRYRVETAFLGLYGTVSPLPNYFTEELLHETEEGSLVRGVLDLFHHRIVSLFYRCWEKYRYHVQYRVGARDEFSSRMLCLIGLGVAQPPDGALVPAARFLRFSGLLERPACAAASLERAVSDYFDGLETRVVQCVARWVRIPPEHRTRLGTASSRLGVDAHAGEEVMDRAGKFRTRLGPVGLPRFLEFLPGENGFGQLDELTRLFVRDRLQYELEVVLRHGEVPDLKLIEGSVPMRLGQTTWLGKPATDPGVVFQEPAARPAVAAAAA
ncbi:MAG: type VI secretion system baseplate subunit TssG [Acidobacteriia bacterium]|nr:type VI secretion system baseplate subunit TssG [Terriglobia bacterium]